jgi:hypothetical protein
MGGAPRPLRIVRTYYTKNHGTGDPPIRVDEEGNHWRKANSYELSGQATYTGPLADITGGFVWPR